MSTRIFVEDNVDLTCVLFHREQSRRHIVQSFNNTSADEKLRSLGGKHHGGTKTTISVVPQQTPHSTSSLGRHPGRPPDSIQIHPTKSVSQEHLLTAPQSIPQKSTSVGLHQKVPRSQPPREPPPDPPVRVQVSKASSLHKVEVTAANDNDGIDDNYPDDSEMSERRIQRLGRRDVGAGKTQQQPNVTPASRAAEIKRRSRSEGPASRLKPRNSMDEKKMYEVRDKSSKSGQYKVKQQRTRHSMYTEPLSDDGGFPDIQGSSTSASDSDEANRKKWVKNPLIVKRMKKSDKRKSLNSATDNTGKENYNTEILSVRTTNKNPQMINRDLYLMQDRNSNNSQKGKYQKLEERRRKRVDITVTSDEELNSPELRISKLRQRALQGTKMATKLPDRLEDAQRMSHTQMIGHMAPELMYRENKHQDQLDQGSSSSEQITLRQIGPGHNITQDRFHQMEVKNNNYNQARFDNVRNNNSNISLKDSYHGHLPQGKDGRISLTGQGSFKKIPKQETDYVHQIESNVSRNVIEVPKSSSLQRSESYGSRDMPERFREQRQMGGVAKYSKAINEFGSNPSYQPEWIKQQRKGGSDTEMSFNEVKTNKPMMLKKAIDRVDRKRKSYSEDDDSLDELIESNIQYLESEIESGKLQKIPTSKPAMFPVNKQDIHQTTGNVTKRKSASLDNVSRPAQSSFQNEVKLRLQIPSSVASAPRQVKYSKPKENKGVYETYGSRSDIPVTTSSVNLPVTTVPSAARTNMYNLYQNTVPNRRHQSATHSPYMQRRSTELVDMEDLSKSDSQLNSAEFAPAYAVQYGVQNQPYKSRIGHVYSTEGLAYYDNVSFPKQEQTNLKSLSVPVLEQGMFSDVEYDIEVSERVKKWEKLMKKKVSQSGTDGSKEAVSLTTILENEGGIPDSWLQDANAISDSTYVPPSRAVSSISVTVTKSTSHIDPSVRKEPDRQLIASEVEDPRVLTTETSSHRIFRLVQQPGTTALTKTTDSTVTYVANPETIAPVHHERQKTLYGDESKARVDGAEEGLQSSTSDKDSFPYLKPAWPPRRNKPQTEEQKQARLSKFEEELSELQELKQDSVKDLRRKFDSEGSGNESTDVAEEVSSACRTPLRQRKQFTKIVYHAPETKQLEEKTVRQTRRRNSGAYSDRSNVVSDVSSPLPEAEVWSPNLESSKGLVSIERVKARTLQTIPFSEDPIWKQIEEMTSFDQLMQSGNPLEATPNLRPGESVAYIKRNEAVEVPCVSYSQTLQSSAPEMIYTTSTSHPKSRAFATPVIKPLKLISSPEKSSIAALDEVLEDIRSSLQKKSVVPGTLERMSPKYSPMLSPSAVKPTQQVFSTPPVMTSSSVAVASTGNMRPQETHTYSTNVPQAQRLTELQNQFNLSTQQAVQPSTQNQQTVLQSMHIIPDYTQEPYIVNGNYQLDPNLLKEKLLSTGLAADGSDVESLHGLMSGRRSATPTIGLYQPLQQTTIHSQQSEAERQVLKTVEDLKNLAKDVEKRLSQIRTKMESSDENKLDSILNALRNFTPAVETTVVQQPTVHLSSEYASKKNKLQEALSELDRIYEELDLKDRPITTVTSEIKGNTVPRQFRAASDTHIYTKKRNKSDSDFSDVGLSGVTIADIERQTQKEFEDINLAFQTLLAEVDNPPKQEEEEVEKTEVYSKDYQSNADEIEATIQSFLQEFGQTQSLESKSSNFNKALEDFNAKKESQNKCRDIQKSEVYAVSSGPFSVVVGLNGKQRRAGSNESSSRAVVRRKRPVPMPSKPNTTHSTGAQTMTVETNEAKPRSDVKVSKANIVIKDPLSDKDVGNDDCSDSSEQSGGNRRFSKRGKRFNPHHRKSLPAEILKRSVETQTIEPPSQVEVIKEKFQPKEFERLCEDSLSSEGSIETRIPQKRKVARNIARKLEIFSSSEDEKGRLTKLSHSHSAPDIRELFDFDKVTSKPGTPSKAQTPRLVKQRYEARIRRKTSVNNRDTPTDEKSEEISWTSATSDDGSQVSQGSKPPVHPGKKQKSSSPDRILADVKPGQTRKASSDAESNVDSDVVVLRRKQSNSQDDTSERPHSFHELLTMFETNPDRLHKLKNSLRKCASADNVSVETVLRKSYHSEPDLREDSPFSSCAKLNLEIKVKNV